MIIDLHNVVEYYGDINLNILEEVLHLEPLCTGFEYEDRIFGTEEKDLYSICTMWSKILRG